VTIRDALYKALRLSNDVRAVRRGRARQRLTWRAWGRITGRLGRRWIR
jgi:hypothetical protein